MAIRPKIQGNRVILVLGLMAAIALLSVQGNAQVVGATVTGTITDPSGASIPNAQVSTTDTDTGITTNVKTGSAGFYTIPNLVPGPYQVTMRADGFQTEIRSGIVLTVGEQLLINGTLSLGQTSQTVEVTGEQFNVDLTSSTLRAEVNATTVRELPLNGRDWTSLATLQPGVVPVRTQASATSAFAPRSVRGYGNQISDAGHRPNENNFRINGISVVDYTNGSPGSVLGGALGVDGIQEFSVLTSNYSAEYGRTTGGVINAITKSGTNAFHGDAYWFMRDEGLDARNFFDPAVIPPFHRNNFGGSAGGPIRKDKTFIFFDYEGIRQNKSLTFQDFVPSAAARAGTLCSIPTGVTPACTTLQLPVGPNFAYPGSLTNANGIDTKVAPFLPLWPQPNSGVIGNGDVGVYNTSGLAQFSENYETLRIDDKISEKDSLAASWFLDNGPFSQPDAMLDTLNENSVLRQMFSLEETHVFSPRLVNVVRVGFNRTNGSSNIPVKALNPLAADPSLGSFPGLNAPLLVVPGLTHSEGLGGSSANTFVFNSYQAYDDAFLTRGTHSLKFGFAYEHMQINTNKLGSTGNYRFPSLQGFLQDLPTSVQFNVPGSSKEVGSRQSIFAGYLQDDWRARSNFTLNLGVRYEPTTLPTEAHNRFYSILGFYNSASVPVHTLWKTNATLRNFEPRVGFSWDPFRNGKTAVRGGFGVFDNLPINWLYGVGATFSSYPFTLLIVQGGLAGGSFPTGAVTSAGFNPAKAMHRFVEQNPPTSYGMNWNLNIQREITPSLAAMVGYVGSHSVHQPNTPDDMDMVLPTLTSAGYLWPFPVGSGKEFNQNVAAIRGLTWGGSASYSGLQVQVTKKMGHGFQAQGAYSWSKCIDDGSTPQVGDEFSNSITSLLWFDKGRRGPCDFNVGQNFVVNYVWHMPKPKFGGAAASYMLGGWEAAGIFTAASGQPFTVLTSGDPQGMKGDANPFPDRLAGCNPYNGNFKPQGMVYLNVNCFSPPVAPASFAAVCQPAAASVAIPNTCMNLQGNAGRNQLTGPGLANLDFSLIKNSYVRRISESFNVQFRVEFFNLLNHANFQLPTNQLYLFNQDGTRTSGGGVLDATSTDSREIQLALKIVW